MIDLFGREAAPASRSPPPAKTKVDPTRGTYGRIGSVSSASANLQSSLESRLRRQLAGAGSTLFALIWKQKVTPRGRPYCQLQASARRTSGSEFGSWPTSTAHDAHGGQEKRATTERHGSNLQDFALTAWATPAATDSKNGCDITEAGKAWHLRRGGKGIRLNDQVLHRGPILSGSPAPTERRGQLNPAFSLWLMGFPAEWESCAPQATPSSRKSRRSL
jgi:hypothetical protein